MPKQKLSPEEQMARRFEAAVSGNARLLGLKRDCDIAEYLGLKRQTYQKRMNNKTAWNLPELQRLFKKLQFTDDQIVAVFRT